MLSGEVSPHVQLSQYWILMLLQKSYYKENKPNVKTFMIMLIFLLPHLSIIAGINTIPLFSILCDLLFISLIF